MKEGHHQTASGLHRWLQTLSRVSLTALAGLAIVLAPLLAVAGPSAQADGAISQPPDVLELPEPEVETKHPVISGLETRDIAGMRAHFDPDTLPVVEPLLDLLPEARSRIVADLRSGVLQDVDIYFLRTIEDYFTAQGIAPRSPHWASGLALLGRDVILIRLDPVAGGRLELDRTLAHELSHIALDHHARSAEGGAKGNGRRHLPHWFVEGFALLQTEEWNLDRAGPLAEAAVAGGLLDFREIDRSFPGNAALARIAYSQSAHFLRWTIHRHGRPQFRVWLKKIGDGSDVYGAYGTTFGESFDEAEAAWKEGLEVEDGWLAIFATSTTLFFAMGVFFVFGYFYVRHRRRRRKKQLKDEDERRRGPPVPEHLENFGPFSSETGA